MNERTRVLTVSAVEFASGFRNNLDALGELCRERGVFYFVDAIQALGAFPIDVQRSGIDAALAAARQQIAQFGRETDGAQRRSQPRRPAHR